MVYIINSILILLYAYLIDRSLLGMSTSQFTDSKKKKIYCILVTIQMILILGLRSPSVGIDTPVYHDYFNAILNAKVLNLHSITFMEFGFSFLNYIIAYFTTSFQWVLFLSAGISIICLGYSIYKNSDYPALSFFLFSSIVFYFLNFCLIRQGIAISIVLLSIPYLKKREMLHYFLIIVGASLFHYTALIMIPLYFLVNIKLNFKKALLFSLLTFGIYLCIDLALPLATIIFPKYKYYLSGVGAGYLIGNSWKALLLCVVGFICLFIFRNQLVNSRETNRIYVNLSFFSILISVFQLKISVLDRFASYTNAFLIFSLPLLINCFTKEFIKNHHLLFKFLKDKFLIQIDDFSLRKISIVLLCLFGFTYMFYLFIKNGYGILPYKLFFN